MRTGISLIAAVLALSAAAMGEPDAAANQRIHPDTSERDLVRSPAAAVERAKIECDKTQLAYPWRAELNGRTWSVWQIFPGDKNNKNQICMGSGADINARTGKAKCFACIL